MASKVDTDKNRLDEAARAGWLYYVAGNTQDEIARKLGVSRQSAQRLVSLAVSERLIKVRLDHPIANCMELSARLKDRFGLRSCEVVPSDPESAGSNIGIALAGAAEMERHLKSNHPKIIAIGTGRSLRACIDQLPQMDCPQHQIVSLLGNMTPDGSGSAYSVIINIADRVNARHYPMPLPVFATSAEEREVLQNQKPVHNILNLARQADLTFVGIGNFDDNAPILIDGFLSRDEMRELRKAGAVGEITSWVYDRHGSIIEGPIKDRVASAPLLPDRPNLVVGIAAGPQKVAAIRGAIIGKLINALITDEMTAEQLLED